MDYIAVIAEAAVAFVKNFDVNAIVEAFAGFDWNGVRDAIISAVESIVSKIG